MYCKNSFTACTLKLFLLHKKELILGDFNVE
jgi:hypothetical protein